MSISQYLFKIVVSLTIAIFSALPAIADNKVFDEIAEMKDVEYVYISKSMISMFANKQIPGNFKLGDIANQLESIEIIEIENKRAIKLAKEKVNSLTNGLEILSKIKNGNEKLLICAKKEKDTYSQIIIFVEEHDEITLINLKGRISSDRLALSRNL
ncbi:MAG: DUF4252 domain-containing protein [Muribaculaceae bacterium]|nr:DUF4252 domain-containing protein [Muribaculaceae bacterium]